MLAIWKPESKLGLNCFDAVGVAEDCAPGGDGDLALDDAPRAGAARALEMSGREITAERCAGELLQVAGVTADAGDSAHRWTESGGVFHWLPPRRIKTKSPGHQLMSGAITCRSAEWRLRQRL